MQERRYRPGDVLDDYCPRERRITDHAIVAMIDDEIRRTRCGVCDAEHEYKEARVPAPRRKTQPPALFNQVLEGMNGPTLPHAPEPAESAFAPENSEELRRDGLVQDAEEAPIAAAPPEPALEPVALMEANVAEPAEPAEPSEPTEPSEGEREGGFRRSLIRATFPRPDGQQPPARDIPEFTIHSLHNRRNGQRHAGGQNKFRGRRRPGGGNPDHIGPMRFRDQGHGQNSGQGHGGGRRRRGGKKNR
ncbi:MAG TPA: hypothetical protein VJ691_12685 [Vicinamibacterales bacterium]|nr:hypothetical protein [Vicinamibacterales bacterium]